ncbi:hypothetical protein PFISCL1PPCAC_8448, partial [Pristionchus fissidentatus]
AAAAPAAAAVRPRRNSTKPSPLDPSVVAASAAVESPGLKSPMTPRRMRKEEAAPRSAPPTGPTVDGSMAAAAAAAIKAATTPTTPKTPTVLVPVEKASKVQQPSTSRQIPPNLDLSPTPTTPNPALRSPRPPIKSAHFDALEAEGERDAVVRTLVFQLQKEMQDEIDRLTAAHRRTLAEKDHDFQALNNLFTKKREDWALLMAAKQTIIADLQNDLIELVKQPDESDNRTRKLEKELQKEKDENDRLRLQLAEFTQPCSSKSFIRPKDPPNDTEEGTSSSNKDSDGFERPSASTRKAVKRPAPDS